MTNGDKSEAVLILEGPPPSIVYTSGINQKALRYHEMTAFPWPNLKTSVEIYNRERRDTVDCECRYTSGKKNVAVYKVYKLHKILVYNKKSAQGRSILTEECILS